jgi:hypothetical protein
MIDNENVFPFNSSKAAFDIFLDDLICSPIKSKIKKAPLGDITNKHQQKLSTKGMLQLTIYCFSLLTPV